MELNVSDLTVDLPSGARLLDIPRLTIAQGTAFGIRGASGAGKTTFLRALMGLLPGCSGQILWDNTRLLTLPQTDRSAFRQSKLGLIFQDFLLFDTLSAQDNAALQAAFLPRPQRSRLRANAAQLLKDVGLPSENRPVSSFSGGERQRVALARALAHDPPVILADEPTANLDRDTGDALAEELLRRVEDRGATLLLVSHDERLLDRMDRVMTLAHGRVAEEAL